VNERPATELHTEVDAALATQPQFATALRELLCAQKVPAAPKSSILVRSVGRFNRIETTSFRNEVSNAQRTTRACCYNEIAMVRARSATSTRDSRAATKARLSLTLRRPPLTYHFRAFIKSPAMFGRESGRKGKKPIQCASQAGFTYDGSNDKLRQTKSPTACNHAPASVVRWRPVSSTAD
jgi:hypothetical protein